MGKKKALNSYSAYIYKYIGRRIKLFPDPYEKIFGLHKLGVLDVITKTKTQSEKFICTIQVILARTPTGVQGDIRCKVLAALSTVRLLELELA